ncbi:zinc-dependent alcohol dehydrogenase family protein [Novosphingobium gossypii]|uniref:zinc-dependent alcohol dehydrogenase family protein n=1 Tax=Novosphingobium gossypii TaxID=1604774 RepID=UPI003D22892B
MKAYTIGSQQGIASLTAVTKDVPQPGPGQVLVKVQAAALNHRDILIVSSKYGAPRPESRVPVSDGVGEIAVLGEGVSGFEAGERVIAPHFVAWTDGPFSPAYFGHDIGVTHDGWLAEYVLIPAHALVKVPDSLTNRQVAALSGAALTAWNAIVEVGKVKAGDSVLALGTGGVSIMALQIARMCGARVAITSSSDEKLEQARALGADVTVNYRNDPEWEKTVFAALGNGADIVIETGGLATLRQSIAAAAPLGRIAIIGALAGTVSDPLPNFGTIIGKNLAIHGIAAGGRAMLQRLVNAIAANGMEPVVNKVFGFDEARDAYAYVHSGDHFGKVMIQIA